MEIKQHSYTAVFDAFTPKTYIMVISTDEGLGKSGRRFVSTAAPSMLHAKALRAYGLQLTQWPSSKPSKKPGRSLQICRASLWEVASWVLSVIVSVVVHDVVIVAIRCLSTLPNEVALCERMDDVLRARILRRRPVPKTRTATARGLQNPGAWYAQCCYSCRISASHTVLAHIWPARGRRACHPSRSLASRRPPTTPHAIRSNLAI